MLRNSYVRLTTIILAHFICGDIIILRPVQKHHHIRILLNGA